MTRSLAAYFEIVFGLHPRTWPVLRASFVASWLALTAHSAWGTCTVGVVGVMFGNYDPFSNVAQDSAGNVSVTCDAATLYTITLSPGSGTYASRTMSGPGIPLNYNLFTDPTRVLVWGDGTVGAVAVPGTSTGLATTNHAVYGRIPARQNVPVGSYIDTVIVTVTF
jgi:spore coat protein U domain-containing protein, fimbrial subunit CupE1/2/3/6